MEKIEAVNPNQLWRIQCAAMEDYNYICQSVLDGKMDFFKVGDCYFVTCLAKVPEPQLVMVCAEGKGIRKAMDAIRQQAKEKNYKSVRIHAFREGMKRLLSKSGYAWKRRETVYVLEV